MFTLPNKPAPGTANLAAHRWYRAKHFKKRWDICKKKINGEK
jgi:hypothetical protein